MAYLSTSDLSELGYTWDDTIESDLESVCKTASSAVDAYIQRVLPGKFSLEANDIEETLRVFIKNGYFRLFPKYYQVNSVTSISILSNMLTGDTTKADVVKINNHDQYIYAKAQVPSGEYFVTLQYNAGFGVKDTVSTLPDEIKKAALLIAQNMISEYFMVKNFNISKLTMFKQGNLQFQRSSKLIDDAVPQTAQLLLGEYRRIR